MSNINPYIKERKVPLYTHKQKRLVLRQEKHIQNTRLEEPRKKGKNKRLYRINTT